MTNHYHKKFCTWGVRKQKLESSNLKPIYLNEGELWWCSVGENVEVEICGKGHDFSRPIVILKKTGKVSFIGVPTTTNTSKNGNWCVHFKHKNIDEVALIEQTRFMSTKRLHTRIGRLDIAEYKRIKEAYKRLFD